LSEHNSEYLCFDTHSEFCKLKTNNFLQANWYVPNNGTKAKILGNISLPWDWSKKTFDLKKAKKNQDGDYLLSYINCVWILNSKQKNHYYYYYFDEPKKVVTIQTIGEIHDAKKLTHQPSMCLTTTIKHNSINNNNIK